MVQVVGENYGAAALPKQHDSRVRVIEIVGPAGVGKSTLTRALCDRCPTAAEGIAPGKLTASATFAAQMTRLIPGYLGGCLGTTWLNRNEMRAMYLLGGWYQQAQNRQTPPRLAVMDHGPIFRLTYLRVFGPPLTKTRRFQLWWQQMLANWAESLEAIVCLEADNEELISRVRNRQGRSDRFQARSDNAAHKFLEDYRRGYDEVLKTIEHRGGPTQLIFNTQSQSPTEIADAVLASLGVSTGNDAANLAERAK